MKPERWDRIGEIFHGALERPEPERVRFVAAGCAGDGELRAEVMALLAAHRAGPLDELEAAVPDQIRRALPSEPAPGTRIGPYRLVERLGDGGMGVVYLARRDDPEFDQRVALKLLRGSLDASELIGRFLTERRILARLEHPNITRLLDGGVTRQGVPYFVMEHVDGQPIHRYCDAERLTVRERVALFLGVCDAMQYAHRHLIVHRDVKPSNILVTRGRTVKVLDFGIARLLDEQEAARGVTRTGQRWMTPEYASPEQVRGDPVTTTSDVYAMGVVLYQLLTGRRPYDIEGRSRHEIERAVLESEPSRPSAAVSQPTDADRAAPEQVGASRRTPAARLRRQLAGDLDTIVLKALHKEPDRRYASAGELADDLRRHLAGLPVRARPDTLRYRLGKFVRRHRAGVAASLLVTMALAGGAAGTASQARRAAVERDRARREAAKAMETFAFQRSLFEASLPGQRLGETLSADRILDRSWERLRGDGKLAGQPAVRAALLDVVSGVYRRLGRYPEARATGEEALGIRRDVLKREDADLAESLSNLGVLAYEEGRTDEAEALFRDALELRRREPGPKDQKVASALNNLAAARLQRGDLDSAERLLREAIGVLRRLPGGPDEDLAPKLDGLAIVLQRQGRLEAADTLLRESLELRRAALPGEHPNVARSLNKVATNLIRQGKPAVAEPYMRKALRIWRKVLGKHPDVARALNNLASALEAQGKLGEAEPLYREALTMKRSVLGDHFSTAHTAANLGLLLQKRGDYGAAEEHLRESLRIRRAVLGENHPDLARALHNLAALYREQGECGGAEPLVREALEIRTAALPMGQLETLESQGLLGECLAALDRFAEAEVLLLAAWTAMRERTGPEYEPETVALQRLVKLYQEWGKAEEAARYRELLSERPGGG